jgi:hypothetical protein
MQPLNGFSDISQSITTLLNDIRAEVIVADLIGQGVSPSDILVSGEGSFRRKYSRDVRYADVEKLSGGQELLEIHLTRDGLYDALPEALFHDPSAEPLSTGHDMANHSKRQKKEEKEARRFFLPFESELFLQRVAVEQEERKILFRFNESLFNDIHPRFWNLDRTLPKHLIARFVLILHYAHRIAGDPGLTAGALSAILDEEVSARVIWRDSLVHGNSSLSPDTVPTLGACRMGSDFLCGDFGAQPEPVMEFTIGPLKNSPVDAYLENGDYARFLECFCRFFVPVELNVATMVRVEESDRGIILGGDVPAYLGYNAGL